MNCGDLTLVDLRKAFLRENYITTEEVLLTVYLALKLEKPLLVEGEPGVGKTELAKVLASAFQTELIRLQCYEGLDENKALYEWNYQKQLLKIQMSKDAFDGSELEDDLFSPTYLLQRPLLKAIQAEQKVVLLIDEVDKTDEEFEAFLFEVLSDFQVSIPELGTIKAVQIPIVILTSNNERELSDGLKRRCVYLYLDFPSVEQEVKMIQVRLPEVGEKLAHEVARAVSLIRQEQEIRKKPSIAETLDWVKALMALGQDRLNETLIDQTLSFILKTKTDQEVFQRKVGTSRLLEAVRVEKS